MKNLLQMFGHLIAERGIAAIRTFTGKSETSMKREVGGACRQGADHDSNAGGGADSDFAWDG